MLIFHQDNAFPVGVARTHPLRIVQGFYSPLPIQLRQFDRPFERQLDSRLLIDIDTAFRSFDQFEGQADLGTWLHRIVINASLMRLRKKGARKEIDLDRLLPEFLDNGVFAAAQPPWEEPADEPAIRRELCGQVLAHIEQLPDGYRIPLLLRDIEGLGSQELAEVLGLTASAARVRVHRARQALRALLAPQLSELR